MTDLEILLRKKLPRNTRIPYPSSLPSGKKPSAVLVVIRTEGSSGELLFTLRGEQLADHGGQVAFPGGHAEEGDSGPLQTALREASEEVGLPPDAFDPVGILDPADTHTGFRIWPVAGFLRRRVEWKPAVPEVREIFWIPLAFLMDRSRWQWKPVPSSGGRRERKAIFYEAYQGHVIWGATAMITRRLTKLIHEGRTG